MKKFIFNGELNIIVDYIGDFMKNLTKNEINDVFDKLNLPKKVIDNQRFEVWEVPPIKRDMHLYSSSD